MKTKMKILVNSVFLLFSTLMIMSGCQKELSNDPKGTTGEPLPPYIISLIDSIPCDSPYYIMIKFEDSEIYFDASDSNISLSPSYSSGYGNMHGRGYSFRDKTSTESAEIMFYNHESNPTFSFQIANYRYGNPWQSFSGANIEFYTPTGEPHTFFRYSGTNSPGAYFWITWIDEYRICGQFKTKLLRSGNIFLMAEGEFTIPKVEF